MEADLRLALAHGEFEVHYQPQINMQTRRADGCEALLRWRCPQRAWFPPPSSSRFAEDIGPDRRARRLGAAPGLPEACAWPEEITVAVNALTAANGGAGFCRQASPACWRKPACLDGGWKFEITENLLLHNGPAVVSTLTDLRALGVRLVLDDFGTGYASLSQLARFAFDRNQNRSQLYQRPGPHRRPLP